MNEILKECLLSLITLVMTILSSCIIRLISIKIEEISVRTKDEKKRQFLHWVANDLVVKCINTTTQTYVESLKASNSFDEAAQKEAMNKTITAVTNLLTESNAQLLNEYVGDSNAWITACVENYIKESKN